MKIYNKLVRDKIPEIIGATGKSFDVHYAKKEDLLPLLESKLNEEVSEYLEAKNLEELADIMEVLIGLANALGYSEKDLINKRNEKKEERGGFEKGVVLEQVYE